MTTYSSTKPDAHLSAQAGARTQRVAKAYVNPYFAGILLGLVLFGAFFLTGSGLGASGGMNRLLVVIEDAVMPEHVDRTPYLMEMAGGSKNPLDSWVVFVTIGTIIGGFTSGWLNNRVKVETNKGPQVPTRVRWVMAFIGGAFMGYGARFARGCTSGQALSGGAVLSWAWYVAVGWSLLKAGRTAGKAPHRQQE